MIGPSIYLSDWLIQRFKGKRMLEERLFRDMITKAVPKCDQPFVNDRYNVDKISRQMKKKKDEVFKIRKIDFKKKLDNCNVPERKPKGIDDSWKGFFNGLKDHKEYREIASRVKESRERTEVYPKPSELFEAFKYTKKRELKVVILGQDPYHQPGVAHGLAFSTKKKETPKSLEVIFKEVENDYFRTCPEFSSFKGNNLEEWATQGVLLLNSNLTVEKGKAGSHSDIGWDWFIGKVIENINKIDHTIVFMLWGKQARSFSGIIGRQHEVLEASHPAAELYSDSKAGFYGCSHFSKANAILRRNKKEPIVWGIYN